MKILNNIFITLSLLCLTACNTDDATDVDIPQQQRISFAPPVVDGISRAVVPDYEHGSIKDGQKTGFHQSEKIMVFGTIYGKQDENKDGNFTIPEGKDIPWATGVIYGDYDSVNDKWILGKVASYDPSVNGWDTEKHHYWVKNKYYAFKAYSPSDLSNYATTVEETNAHNKTYGVEELSVIGYQTPEIGEQFDFMFAETVYEVQGPTPKADPNNPNANPFYNGVNLRFRHALASVHFNVRFDPQYMNDIDEKDRAHEASHYKITSIVLSGVYDKANFLECAGYRYENEHNTYLFNPEGKKQWYNICDEPTAYKSKNATYDFINPTNPITNIPYEVVANDIKAQDIKELNPSAHIGFMIPQAITADAKVVVKWEYNDGKDTYPNTKTFYLNKPTAKNPAITTEWLMGNRYTYTITISNDLIDFSPSTGNWNDNNVLSE